MIKFSKLFFLCFFLLFGCVASSSSLMQQYNPGNNSVYRESIYLRGKTIPLPPGDWKIIASGIERDFFKLYLLQECPGKLFRHIFISVDTLELERKKFSPSDELERTDLHHKIIKNGTPGEPQNSWYVSNTRIHFTPKKNVKVLAEAAEYIRSHGYVVSHDMLRGSHLLTGKRPFTERYLLVNYYYNPETDGFPPGPLSSRNTSQWNPMNVNTDQAKVDYITKIINKNSIIHRQLERGFHPQ